MEKPAGNTFVKSEKTKKDLLDQIYDDILADKVCTTLRDGAIQLVFGDGSVDADIVFIGEAPGKKEDETGLPFVGAAGKFLDEMLQLIHLDRKDIYITNIVKYRPPNNRDPLPEEKKAFWPYLVRQLDVIKPKLVVTLGRHSMEYFLPQAKISEVHGSLVRLQGDSLQNCLQNQSISNKISTNFAGSLLAIYPLYHPAAALYNGSLRQTLLDDFSRIPEILKRINK